MSTERWTIIRALNDANFGVISVSQAVYLQNLIKYIIETVYTPHTPNVH